MRHLARHLIPCLATLLALPVATRAVDAQSSRLLDFEDLAYHASTGGTVLFPGGPIVSGYSGLTWTNFRPLDLDNYPLFRPDPDPAASGRAGYPNAASTYGRVLGLAFGEVRITGTAPGQRFRFASGEFGAGWTDGMTVSVVGRLRGTSLFEETFALSALSSSSLTFAELFVDELVMRPAFLAPGYTDPYGSAAQNGGSPFQTFWMDNIDARFDPALRVVPEPATVALLAGGLVVLAGVARRRVKAVR